MIRQAWRALRLIAGLAFRVDPGRAIGLAIANLFAATSPLRALALGAAVTGVAAGSRSQALAGALIVAALTAGFRMAAMQSLRMDMAVGEKASLELDRRVMQLTDDIPTLEPFEHPEFQNRLELVQGASGAIALSIRMIMNGVLAFVRLGLTFFVLAKLHPALLALPVFAAPTVWAAGAASRMRHRADLAVAEPTRLAGHLFGLPTSVHAAKELRVFGLQEEIVRRHDRESDAILAARKRVEVKSALLSGATWLLFGVAFAAGIALVGRRVVQGQGSPGDVAAALLICGDLTFYVSSSAQAFGHISGQMRSIGHYLWLIDYADAAGESDGPPEKVPARLSEGIRFESVTFRYPTGEADVLSNVDLHLPAGSTVALIGDNGAGKTTLVKLLCGFYQPTGGRILVDGRDLSRFSVTGWRKRLSAAFQDYAKFEFRARDVVAVGDLARAEDDAAVIGALDRAGAADLPKSLDNGLDTQLGRTFGGQDLSAGQWQKLALARAMMREEPLVLVLDEPTASLDAETEHALFERYAGAAREAARQTGAITLLVSHRFTTVRMADLIVVVEDGRITECGTHEELLARGGSYAELFAIQARGYA